MGKWFRVTCLAGLVVFLGLGLLMPACAPKVKTPPGPTWPSEVTSREGMTFYVTGLRIPGTSQEIKIREGGSDIWLPLNQLVGIRFYGPVKDSYRQGQIVLTGGEIIKGELFVDFLIEGTTDLGYWNIPMSKVERLEVGTE
ncbi:MAG: hypothetical protein WC443_11485 [Desulfobaccales bacterium]